MLRSRTDGHINVSTFQIRPSNGQATLSGQNWTGHIVVAGIHHHPITPFAIGRKVHFRPADVIGGSRDRLRLRQLVMNGWGGRARLGMPAVVFQGECARWFDAAGVAVVVIVVDVRIASLSFVEAAVIAVVGWRVRLESVVSLIDSKVEEHFFTSVHSEVSQRRWIEVY